MSNTNVSAAALHRRRIAKKTLSTAMCYLLMAIVAFICAFPFIWMTSASFKTGENVYSLNLIPKHFSLEAYASVNELVDIFGMLGNSVIITVGGVGLNAILGSLCAYPLAKMDFYGKKLVNNALVLTMIIPAAAGMVVNYITIQNMGLQGSFWAVILPNSVNVFSIIMLRQAYLAVPSELLDSARIDGASELRIWWSILLPQIIPSLLTVILMDFINKWNMYLWPLLVLNVDQYPVATGMQYISKSFQYKFTNVAAGTVMSALPVIILFLIFQKQFVNNSMGAVKG